MKEIPIDGQRLYDYLVNNDITQKELSNQAGIQESAISDIINNKRAVSTRYLESICRALNISADYLLGLSDVAERDAKIDEIGMNNEAYEILRQLYGNNDISRGIMNIFFEVLYEKERGRDFFEKMRALIEQICKWRGMPLTEAFVKRDVKVELYSFADFFSSESEFVKSFCEKAKDHFRINIDDHTRPTTDLDGDFMGYTEDKQKETADFYYKKVGTAYEFYGHDERNTKKYTFEEIAEQGEENYNKDIENNYKAIERLKRQKI